MRCVLLNQGIGPDPYFMWLALDSHHLPDAPEANGVLIFYPPPPPIHQCFISQVQLKLLKSTWEGKKSKLGFEVTPENQFKTSCTESLPFLVP